MWSARLAAITIAATAVPARADGLALDRTNLADVGDIEELSLSDLLERPVVAASRFAQAPSTSPTLVSSVDADQIDLLGYRSLGDALRSMPGVYVSNDRNYSYIGLRGFSIPGDYNTRIALAIDGHRFNDVVYGQATPGLELGLPLIAIDHVELARGGAWSVYGQNALLGAIQVVTASGATRPGLVVRATSNATAETFADPAGRPSIAPRAEEVSATYGVVARGIDVFVAATYHDDPGLSATYYPELATPDATCVDAAGKLRTCDGVVHGGDGERLASAYLAIRSPHLSVHALVSDRDKLVPTAAFDGVVGDPIRTDDRHAYADVEYTLARPDIDVDARLSLDYYGYAGSYPYENPREGYEVAPADIVHNQDGAGGVWATAEARARLKRAHLGPYLSDLELAVGTEAQYQTGYQINSDPLPEGEAIYLDRHDDQRMAAVTAHALGRAFDHLVGFAAIRVDDYPDAFGAVVDPQGGLVLDLGEQGRVRAVVSRGYRAPNLYEQYYFATGFVHNPDLGPERSQTRELSYERYLGRHLRATAVLYDQRINDLIELTTLDDGRLEFLNRGTSNGWGVETQIDGRWDRLVLRGSYAWQRSQDETGAERVNSPSSLGVATAMIPIGPHAMFSVETTYVGSRRTLAGNDIEPAFLTTASVVLRNVADGLDLSFGARNLFDVRTADVAGEEHRQDTIPQDPRTIWVQLTARVGGSR